MTCKHDLIQTFRLETGEPVMWACAECMAKFVPMRQLMDEVVAEREACAKVCEERKINPAEWMIDKFYNQAVEHCAAAIRSRT